MPNLSGNAYGLTVLCPLVAESGLVSPSIETRKVLQALPDTQDSFDGRCNSPMAAVPNTYLARFFLLEDAFFQGYPNQYDQLRSSYLVFVAEVHAGSEAALTDYLKTMYAAIPDDIHRIWQYCIDFDQVTSADAFEKYIRRCQVNTTFYFNGSTDAPLAEQLKSLYLKQEFSRFVYSHQGLKPEALLTAYRAFAERVKPFDVQAPTWKPGISSEKHIVTA
ncbi:hypothetical protein [Arsenicibacter rosenii]|uniref:Uncharacterized protein n=1 Tax=Arsenicibacter rosenii TaxID=1750698 RepID=A0A1S2VJ70_9BACT|nr:hypothetical protein [Arsenicibacter rosenii]OIN58811.1 hypothetical protein BLX24_11290 [Arsenicibacter rosenii]